MSESVRTTISQKCGGVAADLSILHQWAAVPLWANSGVKDVHRKRCEPKLNLAVSPDQFACYEIDI